MDTLTRGEDRIALHHHPLDGAPLAVLFPAMGVPAGYYAPFAAELNRAGFAVTVADLRGTGASTPPPSRSSRYGLAELVEDVDAVVTEMSTRAPGRRVVLVGHSLGGQACLLHLARHPGDPRVDGLALIGVGLPYWRLYGRRSLGVLAFSQGIYAFAAVAGYWPGWSFGGRQARGVLRDWAHTARTGRYSLLHGFDAESALALVRTPILAVSVEPDDYTPAPVVDHLVAKVTAAPVDRLHYTSAQAGRRLSHFAWVRAGAPLADRIAELQARAHR